MTKNYYLTRRGDKWAIRLANEPPHKIIMDFYNKELAIKVAKEIAQRNKGVLLIEDRYGKVVNKLSFEHNNN